MNSRNGSVPVVALFMTLGALLVGTGVWLFSFQPSPLISQAPVVEEDKDEHGCINSAGYLWCEEKQKCIQLLKEDCVIATSTDETANWNTYRNEKYGFEFKYPKTIEYKKYGDYGVSITENGVSTPVESDVPLVLQLTEKKASNDSVLSIEFSPAMFSFEVFKKPINFVSLEEYEKQLSKQADEETTKYINEAAAGFSMYTTTTKIGSNEVIEKTNQDHSARINTEKEFIFEGNTYLFKFSHETFTGAYLWGVAPADKPDGEFQSYLLLQKIMKTFKPLK